MNFYIFFTTQTEYKPKFASPALTSNEKKYIVTGDKLSGKP